MSKEIVPFSVPEIIDKFGELPAILADIQQTRVKLPNWYEEAAGVTPQEKHLDILSNRILTLIDNIESEKIEIGYYLFIANHLRLYERAGARIGSMEDLLINYHGASSEFVRECKERFMAYVDLKEYGIEKEQIQSATKDQLGTIREHVSEIKKQHSRILDERAKASGGENFRSMPKEKKEEIAEEVKRDYQRAVQEEVGIILESPPEEMHRIMAQSGKKMDRPLIMLDVRLTTFSSDPPCVELSFPGGRCELSESQIASMKRGNVSWSFRTEDGQTLSLEQLGYWAEDAL